jgi:carotenoid cleavage dioxygenase-like enzyme
MERRAFLRRAAAAGAAAGSAGVLAGLLAGCSDDAASTAATSLPPTTLEPIHYAPDERYWMQANYAPVDDETDAVDLDVTGALPPELTGLYVRNGSNPAAGASLHWFLGDGMVHGVRLSAGKAEWYRNRYVHTPLYDAKVSFLGSGPPGGPNNQSNVSVFHHAGRLLTSGEVGFPYELSPDDLRTIGPHDFEGALTTAMTAHPKIDPSTGQMHFFGYGFAAPYLTYHVADADGRLILSEEVEVAGPTMIHDFAITDRDVIFWELPVVFDLDAAVAMMEAAEAGADGGFPFLWDPSYGARIGVMPLGGPATAIRWVEIEPCYVFHGVNAFRADDDVVIDVCRLPSIFGDEPDDRPNAIHRWTVGTGDTDLTFHDETLSDLQMDLPAIDRRHTGRTHANTWFLDFTDAEQDATEFTGLTRLAASGELDRYDAGERYRVNEGTFVPASPDAADGEGWLLTFAWDRARGASDLMVFDALRMADGPIASVHLPVRVPYGFHGWWLPDSSA